MEGSSVSNAASTSRREENPEFSPNKYMHIVLALPAPNAPEPNFLNKKKRTRETNVSSAPPSVGVTPAENSNVANRRPTPPRGVSDVQAQHIPVNEGQPTHVQSCSKSELTPYVVTIMAGEDIFSKILALCQLRTSAVYIISGSGSVSNVTFNKLESCGGTITYEGIFDIITLSGSFFLSETGGCRTRTGSLTLSLAGPDGRLMGGLIAGTLIAATRVQVMVWLEWK